MQLLPMASSPDGLISAWDAVIAKTPGRGMAVHGPTGPQVQSGIPEQRTPYLPCAQACNPGDWRHQHQHQHQGQQGMQNRRKRGEKGQGRDQTMNIQWTDHEPQRTDGPWTSDHGHVHGLPPPPHTTPPPPPQMAPFLFASLAAMITQTRLRAE